MVKFWCRLEIIWRYVISSWVETRLVWDKCFLFFRPKKEDFLIRDSLSRYEDLNYSCSFCCVHHFLLRRISSLLCSSERCVATRFAEYVKICKKIGNKFKIWDIINLLIPSLCCSKIYYRYVQWNPTCAWFTNEKFPAHY